MPAAMMLPMRAIASSCLSLMDLVSWQQQQQQQQQ
jgi:hypothetical protein